MSLPRLTAALADRYRLERELGQGGMATVYLAEDLKHDRKVAIKVLHPELARRHRRRALPRRDQDHRQPAAPAHPRRCIDSGEADGLALLRHAVRRGRVAARPPHAREAAPRRRRHPHRQRSRRRARLRPPPAASSTATSSPRTSCCRTASALVADFGIALAVQQAGGSRMTADRHVARHAALHEPRAGDGRARRSTPAATSTPSAP